MDLKQAAEIARALDMHPADFCDIKDLAGFLLETLREEASRGVPALQQRDLNGRFLIAMEDMHTRLVNVETSLRAKPDQTALRANDPPCEF